MAPPPVRLRLPKRHSNELVDRTTAAQEDHIVFLPASELYIVINGVTAIDTVLTVVHEALTS